MCGFDCRLRILVDERVQRSVAFAEAALDLIVIDGLLHPLPINSASNEAGHREPDLSAIRCNR